MVTNGDAMDRKHIIQSIRQRYIDRKPLNLSAVKRDQPHLVASVYAVKPYWGWKAALADAGLDYSRIRIEIGQSVACKLCGKRYQALAVHLLKTHEVSTSDYLERFPDAELVSERLREQKTGIAIVPRHPDFLEHWEPIYTPEYVLDRLNEYAQQGFWMESENIVQIDCALIAAIRSYLNADWDIALKRIDLDPAEFRGSVRDSDYTLAEFRKWLENRERLGISCTHGDLVQEYDQWRRRPRMYVWALRQFHNWRNALLAAGVDLSKPIYGGHHYQTKEQVHEEIVRMRDAGENLSHTAVSLLPFGGQLTNSAARLYGTWTIALDAAEVPNRLRTSRHHYDSRDDVLRGIAYRIDNDYSLAPIELYYGWRSDIPLWKKTFEYFQSWKKGVAEAGGNAAHQREASNTLFPTKAKVTAEMKRRRAAGHLLAKREMKSTEPDKHLYAMAVGYFGSWQAAVRAAGFEPKEYHQRNLEPIGKYVNAEAVVEAIRKRQLEQQPLNARGLTHGPHQDAALLTTARKWFGTWQDAIQAAGIDYEQVVRKKQDYARLDGRNYQTYSSSQDVITEIQSRIAKGIPITHRALLQGAFELRDNALLKAGKKFFDGDWDNALLAAGVDLNVVQPEWVRLRKIKNRVSSAQPSNVDDPLSSQS